MKSRALTIVIGRSQKLPSQVSVDILLVSLFSRGLLLQPLVCFHQSLLVKLLRPLPEKLLGRPNLLHLPVQFGHKIHQMRVFFWDTETTSLFQYANPPAILDLAIVDSESGEMQQWLVNPNGVEISEKAQSIHGIDMAKVSECEDFGNVALKMVDFIHAKAGKEKPVLCGFNSHRFDNLVLLAELARYSLDLPSTWLFADLFPHLQKRSSRRRNPILLEDDLASAKNRKLSTIYETLTGKPLVGAHRAAADAIALMEVWKVICSRHPDFELPTINPLEARGARWAELRVRTRANHSESRPVRIPSDQEPISSAQEQAPKRPAAAQAERQAAAAKAVARIPPDGCPPDEAPVDRLIGIGPKTRAALEADGVATVGALRALFAGRLGSSQAALAGHIRGALRVPLGEDNVRRVAAQLALPPPLGAA